MADILLAFIRSLASFRRPRVWLYLAAPAVFSLILWLALAFWGLQHLVAWLMGYPPMTLVVSWGAAWLATLLAYFGAWMLIFALAYLTTALLAAIFVLPWLLKHVARHDYPDVGAMGDDSFVRATVNSLAAAGLFVIGWLVTIPLWLIPGFSLLLPLLLMAWYNRQTFAYDALSVHATPIEWKEIRQRHRRGLFMLGMMMAILTHVPLVGLLVPTMAALGYIHYGLEALRRLRGNAVIVGEARRIEEEGGGA